MDKPNDLFFDIETSPMLVFAWGLGKQVVDYKRIYKERQVLCIGYAFNDEPVQILVTDYERFNLHVRDDDCDLAMVKQFTDLVAVADRVIGHNAKRFDISVLRSRIVKHQLPDFAPILIDDTYSQTRSIGFSSHSLDYMTGYLGLEQKKEHPYELWLDVVQQVPGAMDKMKEYCMGDVDINRQMYHRLEPYIKSSLNLATYNNDPLSCRHCGTAGLMTPRKYLYSRVTPVIQYQCGNCGKYSTVATPKKKKVKLASEPDMP